MAKQETANGDEEKQIAEEAAKVAAAAEQRDKALTDYGRRLAAVQDLAVMTSTENWQRVHRALSRTIQANRIALEACAPKDVVPHQEAIKAIRRLFDEVAKPVAELQEFVMSMPLFAGEMNERAEWNATLGRVVISNP